MNCACVCVCVSETEAKGRIGPSEGKPDGNDRDAEPAQTRRELTSRHRATAGMFGSVHH